ncbi:MAG TPA: hypothetical protein VHB49_11615 [Bradyrhizobium sp.]|nr:hypothetical protein [Bradyrhizobium sp.]
MLQASCRHRGSDDDVARHPDIFFGGAETTRLREQQNPAVNAGLIAGPSLPWSGETIQQLL